MSEITLKMIPKEDYTEGNYFSENNAVKYDLQNGKIETISFCDNKENAEWISRALNLFTALEDGIELNKLKKEG